MHAITSSSSSKPSVAAGSTPKKPPSHGQSFITLEDNCFKQILRRYPDMPPTQYTDDILRDYNDLLHAAAAILYEKREEERYVFK